MKRRAKVNPGQDDRGKNGHSGQAKGAGMGIVDKTLWLIETHLGTPVTLESLAKMLGITPFHLSRSFTALTGQPVMRYVWRRRLTRAAEALVATRASVLTLALDAGYASPEAFTRAFRAEFGLTPRALRQSGTLARLTLTQPMETFPAMSLIFAAPILETRPAMVIAGPSQAYDLQTRASIPSQWVDYNSAGLRAPSPKPEDYYGVAWGFNAATGTFDYLCGQEMTAGTAVPQGFAKVTLPAGRWARFATKGHISTMQSAWGEVYNHWSGQPGCAPRSGPSVEYYPPAFNGMTGEGGYELWVPVA
jgi:AraC family transcriptional regulator